MRGLIAVAVLALAGGAAADTADAARLLLESGVDKFNAGDLEGARTIFEHARALAPDKANPVRWLGLTGARPGAQQHPFARPLQLDGVDVYEGSGMASPRVLANNDLAPVPTLYHANAGGDLTTTAAINALPGARGNFSADPMLAADGIHLNAGSMCIDSGASDGAPAEDYDGDARPIGPGFDVGMDEK